MKTFLAVHCLGLLVRSDLIAYNRYHNTIDAHNNGINAAFDEVNTIAVTPAALSPTQILLNQYIDFEIRKVHANNKKVVGLKRLKKIFAASRSVKLRNYLKIMKNIK